jgi:hypothetical protein
MKRHITCLICCTILLCAAALPARAAVAPKIAARTLDLGPRKGQTLDQVDTGLYSMHLGLDGKTLWLGRTHGVRKVDLATGNWKFFPSTACTGENITAMADTGDALWALTAPEGRICRLEYSTSRWHLPGGWKMRERVFGGHRMIYVPSASGTLYVDGQGGPDSEGISVIDPAGQKWLKLYKTKPVYDFAVNHNGIVAATWDGMVRINTGSGKYKYVLHSEHGCGATVSNLSLYDYCGNAIDCLSSGEAPVLIATTPVRHTELGEAMKVFKDGIAVFAPTPGSPYSLRWRYYSRDENKRLNADYYRLFQAREFDTPGGICWSDSKAKWHQLLEKDGLPGNTVLNLAHRGPYFYAATNKGLAVITMPAMSVTKTFPDVKNVIAMIPAPEGLWVAEEGNLVYLIGNATLTGAAAPTHTKPAR